MQNSNPPTLRTDALNGRSVIVAPNRGSRPGATQQDPDLSHPDDGDPFLEGSEAATPGEILALRKSGTSPNTPGWLVRVVPNRFPTLSRAAQSVASAHNLLTQATVLGAHDVAIEAPDDRRRRLQMSPSEFALVLNAWRQRVAQLEQRPDIAAVNVFRNEGFLAGASLPHVHSQIVATNSVPHEVAIRQQRAMDYRRQHNRDLFDELCAAEILEERRVIQSTNELLVYCPFAGRVAWQVRFVLQSADRAHFSQAADESLCRLSAAIHAVLGALTELIGDFAFNLNLMQSPVGQSAAPWFIDLMPRTAGSAGFEFITDVDIVTTAPEDAAEKLRRVVRWPEARFSLEAPTGFAWV